MRHDQVTIYDSVLPAASGTCLVGSQVLAFASGVFNNLEAGTSLYAKNLDAGDIKTDNLYLNASGILGDISVNSIDASGNLTVTGDLAVDTDTLFVDHITEKVGIGTVSPATILHANSAAATSITTWDNTGAYQIHNFINDNAGQRNIFDFYGDDRTTLRQRMDIDDTHWSFQHRVAGGYFDWYTDHLGTFNEKMRLTSDGNVGIGTTNPGYKLDIYGIADSNILNIQEDGNPTAYTRFGVTAGHQPKMIYGDTMRWYYGATQTFLLNTTGDFELLVGQFKINSDSKPLVLGEDNDYSIQWDGSDAVHTIAAGDFVFTGGNIGIGTVSPAAKLEVDGNIKLNGVADILYFVDTGEHIYAPTAGALVTQSRGFARLYTDTNNNDNADAEAFKIFNGATYGAGGATQLFGIDKEGDTTVLGILSIGNGKIDSSSSITLDSDNLIILDAGSAGIAIKRAGTTTTAWYQDMTMVQNVMAIDDNIGNQLILTNYNNRNKDHHIDPQTDPTLCIFSDTDVDSDATQWLSFAHDKTNAVLDTGRGSLVPSASGITSVGTQAVAFASGVFDNLEAGTRMYAKTADFDTANIVSGTGHFDKFSISSGGIFGAGKGHGTPASFSYTTLEMYNTFTGRTTLNNQTFPIDLQTASTSRLRILADGKVGIGTTSPSTVLEVNGDITADEDLVPDASGTGRVGTANIPFASGVFDTEVQTPQIGAQDGADYLNIFTGITYQTDKYVVCDTFTSIGINAAIDKLGAEGGEVYLPEGTYTIDAEITIDQNNTTLCGAGAGTILDASASQAFGHTINIGNYTHCVIKNIYFKGNAGGGASKNFIQSANSDYLSVEKCYFVDGDYHGIATNGDHSHIINNTFVNCDFYWLILSAAHYSVITGNTVKDNAEGAYIGSTNYVTIANNTITGGRLHIYLSASTYCTVTGNICDLSTWHVIRMYGGSHHCTVTGNIVSNSTGATGGGADILCESDYCHITGNHCYAGGSTDYGIRLDEADYCVVESNSTSGHDVAGIQEDADCQNNLISGNNCQDSTPYVLNGTAAELFQVNGGMLGRVDEITATSGGVASSLTTLNTEVTTNDDNDLDNVTLANGTSGQIKHIYCVVSFAGDTWKITPATMCGGTQITFGDNSAGNGCVLVYANSEGWCVTGNNGGTIA